MNDADAERLHDPDEQLAAIRDEAQVVQVGVVEADLADPGDQQRLGNAVLLRA